MSSVRVLLLEDIISSAFLEGLISENTYNKEIDFESRAPSVIHYVSSSNDVSVSFTQFIEPEFVNCGKDFDEILSDNDSTSKNPLENATSKDLLVEACRKRSVCMFVKYVHQFLSAWVAQNEVTAVSHAVNNSINKTGQWK